MAVVVEGDGTLYGQTGAYYGVISNALATAQDAQVRETALKVSITNERVNAWEYFAGTTINGIEVWRPIQFTNGARKPINQDYWSYRGSAATVKLSGGNIVRIRNTDGSEASRIIQIQTITDPTVASQWTTWSTLYSGTHYCCAIVPSGASYDVYHAKADGLYKNNSLVWSKAGIVSIQPVEGQPKAVFITVVVEDPVDGDGRYRDLDIYYTSNIDSVTPTADPTNYRWSRNYIYGYKLSDSRIARFQSNSWYFNPRIGDQGNSTILQFMPDYQTNTPSPPRLIRGVGGGANGRNYCVWPFVRLLSDGYYYLYYMEIHEDSSYDFVTNLYGSLFWQRSKDMRYWSEPTAIGFNGWNFNNVIEHSGYAWLIDNGAVWRRPLAHVTLDFSNYVPELEFDIPRDNQPATGSVLVANPAGVNDGIISLGDRAIKIEIGMKIAGGSYEYKEFNKWFVLSPTRQVEPITGANRITIPIGDIWARLANPLRDTFNLVGKLDWYDWDEGCRNRAFNYYFVNDAAPVENELIDGPNGSDVIISPWNLTTNGNVLYTGWKGHNGSVRAHLTSVSWDVNNLPAIIYRYVDENNYYRVQDNGSTYQLVRKRAGVETVLASGGTATGNFGTIKVVFTWAVHQIYDGNNNLIFSHTETVPGAKPGYTGVCAALSAVFSRFHLIDFEDDLTSKDLVKLALAFGDFHDAIVSNADSKQLAITWGPQTDIPTPADALMQMMTAEKLQLIWRNGQVEVGRFSDPTIKKVIEDRIIETDYIDNANQRINFAAVDGNLDSWLEFDAVDIRNRDRQLNAYFDLPELDGVEAVKARAQEEIKRSTAGRSPGGKLVLYFDLDRMDNITWVDNSGLSTDVRIEGMKVMVNQSTKPKQTQELDTSLLDSSSTSLISPDASTPA